MIRPSPLLSIVVSSLLIISGSGSGKAPAFPLENEAGAPAEQQIGERLFVDTRFAEYFAAHMTGVNDPLAASDPVVAQVQTPSGSLFRPVRGTIH